MPLKLALQVSTNDNGFLREEKPIKRLGLQRVASITANKGIPIEQYIVGFYSVISESIVVLLENLNLT